jgi:hypothetical protein
MGDAEVVSEDFELLAAVRAAIEKKVGQYSASDRARLLLVLDANRLPAITLDPVRERLLAELGAACVRSGFVSVWVVGPTAEMMYELSGSANKQLQRTVSRLRWTMQRAAAELRRYATRFAAPKTHGTET